MTINPVARRELQERFRTLRSPVLLAVWVLAAGAVTFLAYVVARNQADDALTGVGFGSAGFGSVIASASMGRFILHTLLLGLMTAVLFVVPGQAAVTIVGERERQTLPLLQVSQLSAGRIIVGKLLSALAYILLLLVATTPLLVIPVLLGGVTILDVAAGVGMVMATAFMIGAVSMWVSARARSVQGAVMGSYVWAVALVLGTLALVVAEWFLLAPEDLGPTRFQNGLPRDDGRELYSTWINPYVGMVDASSDVLEFRTEVISSPYSQFRPFLIKRQGFRGDLAVDTGFSVFGDGFDERVFESRDLLRSISTTTVQARSVEPIRTAVWWKTLLFMAAVSVAALFTAARLIKVPRTRMRLFRRRVSDAS